MQPSRRQWILTFVAAFGLAALAAGCASSGGGERGPRRDPNLLTAEELAPHSTLTLREAIAQLRPRWLQGRGGQNNPIVVQDGNRMGSGALDTIRASDVESAKYLNAADGRIRYGATVSAGAIEVVTRRR